MPPRIDRRRARSRGVLALASVLAAVVVSAPSTAPHGSRLIILQPTDGALVSGSVPWQIAAEGRSPKAVDFSVDGSFVGRDDEPPFELELDTSRFSDGTHVLTVSGRGGGVTDATMHVTVANETPTQPPPPPPPPPPPTPPVATSGPTISGAAVVGNALIRSAGTWTGTAPISSATTWLRCDAAGEACSAITGATAETYAVAVGDAGRTLRVAVKATNEAGSESALSTATEVVAPVPASTELSCDRPYAASSPWNTPIGANATVVATSAAFLGALGDDTFTSQPLHYAYPVYTVDALTPLLTVVVRNTYNDVSGGGSVLTKRRDGYRVTVPLPVNARPSDGTDGHLIVVDRETGDEWGFWQASKDDSGQWHATNGYHYNVSWSGVPPAGFGSRGAGVTYLAGLIRPCEIARGRVDHALAFAYNYPRNTFVYPATKSDGLSTTDAHLPEGARLQLDPALGESTIRSWGCVAACLVVARAMQEYGMYVVDNSGRDKIYTEDESTARWIGAMTGSTLAPIPKRYLRWVAPPG